MYRFKKEITALLNGESVQFKAGGKWHDVSEIILYCDKGGDDCWISDNEAEIRIKPKPVPHLKPCPFCGGTARASSNSQCAAVECTECPAMIRLPVIFNNPHEKLLRIIEKWNTRAFEPEPTYQD